jgi:hypothetical protein
MQLTRQQSNQWPSAGAKVQIERLTIEPCMMPFAGIEVGEKDTSTTPDALFTPSGVLTAIVSL